MNIIEKRDYIHNHLINADEQVINEMFMKLKEAVGSESLLQEKLILRARQAEKDIVSGRVYNRKEVEQRLKNIY